MGWSVGRRASGAYAGWSACANRASKSAASTLSNSCSMSSSTK
jgi:hypothetical protein